MEKDIGTLLKEARYYSTAAIVVSILSLIVTLLRLFYD